MGGRDDIVNGSEGGNNITGGGGNEVSDSGEGGEGGEGGNLVKGDEASEDDDAAGEGDDGGKNDHELWKDRSPSSLDDGEAAGGTLRHSGPVGGIVTGAGMAGPSQLAFTAAGGDHSVASGTRRSLPIVPAPAVKGSCRGQHGDSTSYSSTVVHCVQSLYINRYVCSNTPVLSLSLSR